MGNDRSRTNWTPEMERFFIDIMLDQARKGNMMGHTFNKQAWNDMLVAFNENFGSPCDVNVLKSRYSNLWTRFNDVKTILGRDGFSWDKTRKIVVAEKSSWDAYIKVNPDAKSYRNKVLANIDDLCLIYAHTLADGRYSLSSHDVDFDDDILLMNMAVGANFSAAASKDQSATNWTLEMDRYFMNLMLEQIKKGNKINNTFPRRAWNDMLRLINAKFSTRYGKKNLKLRHKKLLKYYTNLRSLLEVQGFFWDEKNQTIVADDIVWYDYIKAHPEAHCYMKKSLLNYIDLELIYENAMSNGVHQQSYRRKYFENDVLPSNLGDEKKMDSFGGDGLLARSEDLDNEDLDSFIDEEEIQSDIDGGYASIEWTPSMDRCLIDILLEKVDRIKIIGYRTDDQVWIDMVALFKDRFGVQPADEILRSRYKSLEKQYLEMKDILGQRGFWWNETQQMVTACDDIWDAYIEQHPGAKSYRRKSNPNYNDLCLIYGNSASNRRCNQSGPKLSNGYRWRTDWTPKMDRYFINLMLEQVYNGSMLNQKFSKLAWADIAAKFGAEFGSQYDKDVLKSRFINLRKRFNDMKAIVDHGGFAWDEMQQRVIADEDLWDAYVEEYPDARSYRNRNLPNFNDLYLIFGNAISTEKNSCSSCSTEDDNREVNDGNKDDQSPANISPSPENRDVTSYGDGIIDCYDEFFTSFGGERSSFFVTSEAEGEFEIPDRQKKRKSGNSSKSEGTKRVLRTVNEEMEERFEEDSGLLNWLTFGEEEEEEEEKNGQCSIESVVGALEAVPDMTDELFLEACEYLGDERKAEMFVAMDVAERKEWLLRKLSRKRKSLRLPR